MASQAVALEQLRLLPEDRRVEILRDKPEDQWFERTSSRIDPRDLADLMIGVANADGGLLCVGIHDGRVEGVAAAGPKRLNEWRQAAIDFTEPPIRHRFEIVPCANDQGVADELVLIEIDASERVHRNHKEEVYLRIGDENRRLRSMEAQEIVYDKGQSAFDGGPVDAAERTDLDDDLVEDYVKRLVSSPRRADDALVARGLLVPRGNARRPSVAGVLVLGASPQRFFPEGVVRVLRYRGSVRATGSRANVDRDIRITGSLAQQIQGARRRVRRLLPSAIRLQETGRFAPSPAIPEAAWLEAIVNAVVHRSYSMGGDHVRVELFDDRLEVESPGRLPGLVNAENIRDTRFARNPRIARAMADLDYGRELGEGVNRMFEEMQRAGFPEPLFTEGPASVKVTLLFESVFGAMLTLLPPGSERFVEYVSRTGRVTTTEATDLLGMSRPTALSWLWRLQEDGAIEHVGTSPKDPRGFWRPIFTPRSGRRRRAPRGRS